MQRPYVIISTAMSLDGFIDDTDTDRLILSNKKDLERVKLLRDSCDAILVGANTIRKDNPRLLPNNGKKLTKITLTNSGSLDTASQFFKAGDTDKIVYTLAPQVDTLAEKLAPYATVVSGGEKSIALQAVLADLHIRGIKRLLVEGGSSVLTQFLQEGLADELHIAIAGLFVGEKEAPRFVQPGKYAWNKDNRMHLDKVTALDDIAVLIYKI